MPLTPKDIEQQTFRASFRGYAEDEVDMFLEEVILSIGEYQQLVRDRDARLADGGAADGIGTDDARQRAASIVAGARAEADKIVAAARAEADALVVAAQDQARALTASAGSPREIPDALSADQMADRERLLVGYQALKDELNGVRARLRRALSASEEAFGIVEGQVSGIIEAAVEPGSGHGLEPGPEQVQVEAVTDADADAAADADADAEVDLEEDGFLATPPRRPWER